METDIDRLVVDSWASLHSIALHITQCPQTAWDVFMDTYLKVSARGSELTFAHRGVFVAYYKRAMLNTYWSLLRKKAALSLETLSEYHPKLSSIDEDELETYQIADLRLLVGLKDLPHSQRQALLLACEGYPHQAAAQVMGISTTAYRQSLFRARKAMKSVLAEV